MVTIVYLHFRHIAFHYFLAQRCPQVRRHLRRRVCSALVRMLQRDVLHVAIKRHARSCTAEETNTIYEFNGTVYHGDPRLCDPTQNNHYGDNYGELYKKTLKKEQFIKEAGYNLVVMWEHDWNNALKCVKKIQKIFRKNRKILKTPLQ